MNHAGQAQRKGKEPYRILLTILTGIAGIALFGGILLMSQSRMAELALQEEMKENSSYITNAFTYYEASGKTIQGWSDRLHETYFFMMKYALEQDPDLLSDQSSSEAFLGEMTRLTGAQDIMLVDRNGNVLASDTGFFRDLKEEMYAPLFHTFDTFEMEKLPIYAFTAENRQSRLTPADPQDSNGAQTAQVETEKIEAGPPEQAVDSSWKESYYGASNSFPILYSMAIDDQRACVINDYGVVQMMYEDLTDVWNYILKNEVIGSNGYAFVWSAGTGEILYYPEPDFKGRDVSVLGMDMDGIHNGTFVREKVNGEDMYLYPVYFDAQGVWIACAVPAKALTRGRRLTGLMLWLLFGVLAADLAYYAILLLKQKKAVTGGGILPFVKQRPESSRKTKLLIFTAFCTIAIFLSAFYVQTLYLMSDWARNGTAQIERIINDLSSQEILVKGIRQFYADGSEKLAKLAGWYLEKHPEKATTDTLDTLTDILTLENISIVDKAGNVTTASSAYLPEFVNAAEAEESTASTKNSDIATPGNLSVTIPLRGEKDGITGYLTAEYNQDVLGTIQLYSNLSGTLKTVQPGEGGIAFAVDANSGRFTWHPDSFLIGKNALDYGLKESDLQNNLCKYIQLNRDACYAVTGQYGNDLIFLAIRDEILFRERLPISVTAALAALAILLMIGLWLYTCPKEEGGTEPEAPETLQGRKVTAEHKVFRNLVFGAVGFAVLLLLVRCLRQDTARISLLEYVLSGNWEHGLNVFALTASLIFMLQAGLILFLFRSFMDLMTKMVSVRTETVIRMLVSLVTYITVFFVVFRCLVLFGMEPSALLASAGIVSVVIGIGANSLVGDIIAGVFLLAEGNIQVGDMITVEGFRGIVEDLGMRMTKIYDVDSENIKIIPNKEMQKVVHMSAHLANVCLEYPICYEEDLERAEKLFIEELKKPDGRIPEIIGDLSFMGLRRLDESGVVLMVKARCHEAYRPKVTRAVNRKIYMMYLRNGIKAPYPQLTVHNGDIVSKKSEK